MRGDEEEVTEGTGEEKTGDCDVEAGVSPSPSLCGVNVSFSALSVEMEQGVAGKDVSELAVSTPESTESERRVVPVSEEGEGESSSLFPEHWPSSVTQASIRFPKLLYRFIFKPVVPHTSTSEVQQENEQDTSLDSCRELRLTGKCSIQNIQSDPPLFLPHASPQHLSQCRAACSYLLLPVAKSWEKSDSSAMLFEILNLSSYL